MALFPYSYSLIRVISSINMQFTVIALLGLSALAPPPAADPAPTPAPEPGYR